MLAGYFFCIIPTFSANFLVENLVYIINYFIFALAKKGNNRPLN